MWTTHLALWMLRNARQRVDALLVTTPRELRDDKYAAQGVAEYLTESGALLLKGRGEDETVTLRCSVQVDD